MIEMWIILSWLLGWGCWCWLSQTPWTVLNAMFGGTNCQICRGDGPKLNSPVNKRVSEKAKSVRRCLEANVTSRASIGADKSPGVCLLCSNNQSISAPFPLEHFWTWIENYETSNSSWVTEIGQQRLGANQAMWYSAQMSLEPYKSDKWPIRYKMQKWPKKTGLDSSFLPGRPRRRHILVLQPVAWRGQHVIRGDN